MLRIVGVSGTAEIVQAGALKAELNRLINRAMKELYLLGMRRFRTRAVRTGDSERFIVMGWPK